MNFVFKSSNYTKKIVIEKDITLRESIRIARNEEKMKIISLLYPWLCYPIILQTDIFNRNQWLPFLPEVIFIFFYQERLLPKTCNIVISSKNNFTGCYDYDIFTIFGKVLHCQFTKNRTELVNSATLMTWVNSKLSGKSQLLKLCRTFLSLLFLLWKCQEFLLKKNRANVPGERNYDGFRVL